MSMQQMLLGVGAVATKTYVDDVFSTFLYKGNSTSSSGTSTQALNNNLDFTKGGLVWLKRRNGGDAHYLIDTVRGTNKTLSSNTTTQESTDSSFINSFNNNGVTIGPSINTNYNNDSYSSWSFRKAPGFFDVVAWTGDGSSNRQISHSLSSIPGCIIVKKTSASDPWSVYHRSLDSTSPENYRIFLDEGDARLTANTSIWNQTKPTSSNFTVGSNDQVNGNGKTYVAYLFAGGESTQNEAVSVDFDGSGDYLSIPDSSDFNIGSSEFTIEGWIKVDALNSTGAGWLTSWSSSSQRGWYFGTSNTNKFVFAWSDTGSNINTIDSGYTVKVDGQFHHYAVTRSGTTLYFYVDGLLVKINTSSGDTFHNSTGAVAVGYNPDGGSGWELNGKISNLRFVKGTVVYTSSFRPPTEPLTNITNTKLLCCNNSSVTGSTVTPGTITANGDPTASTDSPFDDPAGFVFGESGSENVIKCGSYVGNGDATNGTKIHLGFEPQWLLIKSTGFSEEWHMFDCMRGIVNNGNDIRLEASTSGSELTSVDFIDVDASGFTALHNPNVNKNNEGYIYMAIRRPDGYCGKLPSLGTSVFAMDTGNGSTTIPAYDSGFPVDFALDRRPAASENWYTSARLMGAKWLKTNASSAETSGASYLWDSNVGYVAGNWADSNYQSWMWKRHAGFDVVTYAGNSTNREIRHSMGIAPTMVWLKSRTSSEGWVVGSSGLSSWAEYLTLNNSDAESTNAGIFNSAAPTATHFSLGSQNRSNENNQNYIAMLFASVDGISKVGYYTGNGNSSGPTVTLGFAPRLVIIKCTSNNTYWYLFDTFRGISYSIALQEDAAQDSNSNFITVNSTGFQPTTTFDHINGNNEIYTYYAHA